MNKTAIKNFAVWARRKLISEITYKAGLLGVTEKGAAEPLPQSTKDLQFFDIGTKTYAEVQGAEIAQRNALVAAIRDKAREVDYKTAFQNVVEEVAYTWFNRMIAIRFMEINDYLPSRVRVLSSENPGKLEPDFVTNPFDTDLDFTPYERDRVLQFKDENKLDELFRALFIKQCNKLHEILPELFEATRDYTELLLTISFTDKDGVVYHLTHDIPESDFDIPTPTRTAKRPVRWRSSAGCISITTPSRKTKYSRCSRRTSRSRKSASPPRRSFSRRTGSFAIWLKTVLAGFGWRGIPTLR